MKLHFLSTFILFTATQQVNAASVAATPADQIANTMRNLNTQIFAVSTLSADFEVPAFLTAESEAGLSKMVSAAKHHLSTNDHKNLYAIALKLQSSEQLKRALDAGFADHSNYGHGAGPSTGQ